MAIKVLTPHSFKNILINIPGFLEQNTSIIMHSNRLLTMQMHLALMTPHLTGQRHYLHAVDLFYA
jgi:hypothetical protein